MTSALKKLKHWWIAAISLSKRPRTAEAAGSEQSTGLGAHNKSLGIKEIPGELVSFEKSGSEVTAEKLLGGLLKFLRESDNFKILSECREIEDLIVEGKTIVLCANSSVLEGLRQDEFCRQTLTDYFERCGYELKFGNKEDDSHDLDDLKALLGDGLVIK